jgi:hypothetical protein
MLSRRFLAQIIFSILKMEAISSSETSVDTQRTTRRYMDGTVLRMGSGRVVYVTHSKPPHLVEYSRMFCLFITLLLNTR